MFLLPSISTFKSAKWSHKFLTASAALPSSDLIVGAENVSPVSCFFNKSSQFEKIV